MRWFSRRSVAQSDAPPPSPDRPGGPRILILCESMVLRGGLLRFERFGRALRRFGGDMAFVPLHPGADGAEWRSDFPLLTAAEAAAMRWDATMVPGAGFGSSVMRRLADFRGPGFGVRVQHVLNDMQRPDGFFTVRDRFAPDVAIFNNRHWTDEAIAGFGVARVAVLEGAVDLEALAPSPFKTPPAARETVTLGGLANKNFGAVIRALALLPDRFRAEAIGRPTAEIAAEAERLAPGRVRFRGPVPETELAAFHAGIDIAAHVERRAGWANHAAEALACGTPLIATTAGALSLAEHERTALVLDEPEPAAIAAAALRLVDEPDLARRLATAGRERIAAFGWNDYARRLLDIALGAPGSA